MSTKYRKRRGDRGEPHPHEPEGFRDALFEHSTDADSDRDRHPLALGESSARGARPRGPGRQRPQSAPHLRRRAQERQDRRLKKLARLARLDPKLLSPIKHRGEDSQAHLALLRSRDALVGARTKLVNDVRAAVKSFGGRLPKCTAENFHNMVGEHLPWELASALEPILGTIASLTECIREYDRRLENVAEEVYPETKLLRQVHGVGVLTALAFVLTLEDPSRFAKSREVGAYLGLVPATDLSGGSDPEKRISKHGNKMMRRLLVGSAHYILGPFVEDSDLRRHGEKTAGRGGKNAKKRAVVAVARKLAVLLHRLWVTAEVYEPLYNSSRREGQAA